MALVSQEADLFDRSIADNIKYGDVTRQVSDEEMFLAAQRAHIHDFILNLPDVCCLFRFLEEMPLFVGLFNNSWISCISIKWWRTTTPSYSTSINSTVSITSVR